MPTIASNNGNPRRVKSRLGEDAAELGLTRLGLSVRGFAGAALGVFRHRRHARAIHGHIESYRCGKRTPRAAADGRAFGLMGGLGGHTDRLANALHGLGRHDHAGQFGEVLTRRVERLLCPHACH